MAKRVKLTDLSDDKSAQPRGDYRDKTVIREYMEQMEAGAKFPPIVVYGVDGAPPYVVADGFHRINAAMNLKHKTILADIRDGDVRAAVLYSASANAQHGLRRNNIEKRRAVELLLEDPEWSQWSDNMIAEHCAVSHPLVAAVRADLAARLSPIVEYSDADLASVLPTGQAADDDTVEELDDSGEPRRIGRDGKSYPARPRTRRKAEAVADEPVLLDVPFDVPSLAAGDRIEVTDPSGESHSYVVVDAEQVEAINSAGPVDQVNSDMVECNHSCPACCKPVTPF